MHFHLVDWIIVVVYLAGTYAERRYDGRRRNWQGARSDTHEAFGLLYYITPAVNGTSCTYNGSAGGVKVPAPQ